MNKYLRNISYILALAGMLACSESRTKTLDDCPVVASIFQTKTDSLLVCEQQLMQDTLDIPLSLLAEDFELIRLDNSKDEALVGEQMVVVSDNHLLVWNHDENPIKLFDRKGNYLRPIGSFGQGPGEYKNIYDACIDEDNNRIYLLQWLSNQLLVYDLEGNILPPISLCARIPKGKLLFQPADSLIAIIALPFPETPAVAWTQNFNGKRINSIEPGTLTAYDYNSEVYVGHNTDAYDFMIKYCLPTREDTLYHFDYKNNRLQPRFTMRFTVTDPIPDHAYQELAHYYIGNAAKTIQLSENLFGTSGTIHYIIDKNTRKGAYMHLINDFLGDEDLPLYSFDGSFPPFPNFRNGYYILNMDPGNLRDILGKSLKSGKLSPERQKKLSELEASIQENDNNYILLAKLKK